MVAFAIAVFATDATKAYGACVYDLSPSSRNHGYGAATGTVSVATFGGCNWTAGTTNSWITILSGASGSGSGTVTYSVAANPNTTTRTGAVFIAGITFPISQNPGSCNYNLSPTSRSHGYTMATGLVTMTATATCPWNASTTNNWITFLAPFSGTGNGSFNYVVAANTNGFQRVGYISAADDFLTITQRAAPCVYSITPSSRNHGYGAATGIVSVTTSGGCAWTVTNTSPWITILSGSNGVNVGDITYSVLANTNGFSRSGVIAIADQNFSVNQAAGLCTFTISPTTFSNDGYATNGAVTVGAVSGCAWLATTTNSWISINGASGTGSGAFSFSLTVNLGPASRNGAIQVAGQQILITQAALPPCSYKISPVSRNHGFGAGSNYVTITTSNYCPWNVVNTNSWVTIVDGSGTGSANVGYLVSANPSTFDRTGTVIIADQLLILTQSGGSCSYSISPTNRTHGYAPTNNAVVLTTSATNCAWNVVSTNTWISLSITNGVGSAAISYFLATNASYTSRTGTVLISGQPFTIVQRGVGCPFDLTPSSRSHGYSPATNTVSITADIGCTWTVLNTNSWVSFLSVISGTGNGTVTYVITGNTNVGARTGYVQIGDQIFTVVQGGIGCDYSISPTNRNHGYGAATNGISLTVNAGCEWMVVNTNNWVTINSVGSGFGNATITYSVAANPSTNSRSGLISIADQNFTINQGPAPCTMSAVPNNFAYDAGAATGFVNLNIPAGCPWTIVNTNSWILFPSGSTGNGSAVVTFNLNANPSTNARSGTVTAGGASVAFNQAGFGPCAYKLTPVNRTHGPGAASNYVAVGTASYCSWTATSTNSWITIATPASGTGNGNVGYLVAANAGLSERTGSVIVADQILTLIQRGAPCDYSISPTNRSHGFGMATNSIIVTATPTCTWSVVNSNSWITIIGGQTGSGNGTVSYVVSANFVSQSRTGQVMIADQVLTIAQKPVDPFAFDYLQLPGGQVDVRLSGGPGGPWNIEASDDLVHWAKITSVTNTTGSVEYLGAPATNSHRFYRAVKSQ